jgi:ligand-binding SRPBCC domain-containing protein
MPGDSQCVTIQRIGSEYLLETQVELAASVEAVFPFFADVANLEELTPAYLHFQILTQTPLEIGSGTLVDYRLRLRGIPLRWRTEISEWEPPRRFVDRQLQGPYKLWVHEHRFQPTAHGTLVVDRVRYVPPLGFLTNRLLVAPDLRRIFKYRRDVMKRRWGTPNS